MLHFFILAAYFTSHTINVFLLLLLKKILLNIMENLHSRLSFWPVALLHFVFAVWCRPGQLQAPTIHLNQTVFLYVGGPDKCCLLCALATFYCTLKGSRPCICFFRGKCFEAVFVSFIHHISKPYQ